MFVCLCVSFASEEDPAAPGSAEAPVTGMAEVPAATGSAEAPVTGMAEVPASTGSAEVPVAAGMAEVPSISAVMPDLLASPLEEDSPVSMPSLPSETEEVDPPGAPVSTGSVSTSWAATAASTGMAEAPMSTGSAAAAAADVPVATGLPSLPPLVALGSAAGGMGAAAIALDVAVASLDAAQAAFDQSADEGGDDDHLRLDDFIDTAIACYMSLGPGSRVKRVKVSGKSIALIQQAVSSSLAPSSSSFGQPASSSSAQDHVLVEFWHWGSATPHMTVVPAHFTSEEVAKTLELEGCAGAYKHISNGPWAQWTMKELQMDPDDPHVIFR